MSIEDRGAHPNKQEVNMEEVLKFPLDIQTFAEGKGDNGTQTTTVQGNTGTSIDYDKLAEVVSRRSAGTEDKVLQGYFKQQGLTSDQAAEAIHQYKQAQATKQQEEQQRIANMQSENEKLKAQILNANIDQKVAELAGTMELQTEKVPFLCKLIDRTNATEKDGKLIDDNIKKAIEEVVTAFPDFKSTSRSGGFQQIGGGSQGSGGSGIEETLDAIFGITKK